MWKLNVAVLITLLCLSSAALSSTVVPVGNASFEEGSPLVFDPALFGTIPVDSTVSTDLVGGWGHNDGTRAVVAENGVTPYDGQSMLRFDTTGHPGPDYPDGDQWQSKNYTGNSSDVVQIIDLSSYASLIATGSATLTASVWVNRVDEGDDNLFRLSLWSFFGPVNDLSDPANTPTKDAEGNYEGITYGELYSDADVDTWELLTVDLLLPSSTTFVRLGISALENPGTKTATFPELAGHYADMASLTITAVPLPAAGPLMFAALGALGFLGFRGRRRRNG